MTRPSFFPFFRCTIAQVGRAHYRQLRRPPAHAVGKAEILMTTSANDGHLPELDFTWRGDLAIVNGAFFIMATTCADSTNIFNGDHHRL